MIDKTMKQVKIIPNPTGKGGFAEHPENISDGSWNSKMTFSYQYKRFLNMTVAEYKRWGLNTKDDEKTTIEAIAYSAVGKARNILRERQEVADRTEGKALQRVEANVTNISDELDKLEKSDYDKFSREIKEQIVEDDSSLQDKG